MKQLKNTNLVFSNKLPWKLYRFFDDDFQRKVLFKKIKPNNTVVSIPFHLKSDNALLILTNFINKPNQEEIKLIQDLYESHPNMKIMISDNFKDEYTVLNQNRVIRINQAEFLVGEPYFENILSQMQNFKPSLVIDMENGDGTLKRYFIAKMDAEIRMTFNLNSDDSIYNVSLNSPKLSSSFLFRFLKLEAR
tara:strand:- start:25 stop:600 length:576 start_codon:yes stop_codon:yes gene_type:complete